MSSFRMQNAEDDDKLAFDPVENLVRKPPRDQSPKVAIIKRTTFRISFQQVNRAMDFVQKLSAQSLTVGFRTMSRLRVNQPRRSAG